MKAKKFKVVLTIVAEFEVDMPVDNSAWPDCKTIQDVAEFEAKQYKEGGMGIDDILNAYAISSVTFKGVER